MVLIQDLNINATYFYISGGRVEIGTEKQPFLQKAVITLHGDRWRDVEIPNVGSKVLAVSDATFTSLVRHNHMRLVESILINCFHSGLLCSSGAWSWICSQGQASRYDKHRSVAQTLSPILTVRMLVIGQASLISTERHARLFGPKSAKTHSLAAMCW